jgi:phytanoyl-CoA hydroxylase
MQIVRDVSLVKKNKGAGNLNGEANITKLQDFQFDDVLQSYCTNSDLLPYLKSFCGDNIKSVHTMFINKPPGMGSSSRHPFHQDLAYFPFGPADRIVAAWAALEDSNYENGSLNILPKTHKGRFFDHEYPDWNGMVNKAYFGIKEYEKFEDNRINLDMKKGDIVFFHPLLIHGSG